MRSERARFLDKRERRVSDESSPFSALGKTGVVSMPLPRAVLDAGRGVGLQSARLR